MSEAVVNLYKCDACGYRYTPSKFKGLDFDAQPADFECPNCQASRDHFHLIEPASDDIVDATEDGEDLASGVDPSGPRKMYTRSSSQSLAALALEYNDGSIITQPDFQRYEVWSPQRRSALIESILLDLPIPQVFLAQDEDDSHVVIDGQQRMMSVFRYMNNEFALKGVPKSLEGKTFKELPANLQKRIRSYELPVVRILKESDSDIRFMLFQRLNEGSVSLNDQELRNCVWRGDYNKFIKDLADDTNWRKLLKMRKRHPRMVDVELTLRFMAFRDQKYMAHPDKKTSQFLDQQMKRGATYKDKDYKAAARDFRLAIELANTVFGANACRRFVAGKEDDFSGSWDSKVNRALMDVQLWGFGRYTKGAFVKHADAVREAAIELMSDPEFSDLIAHTISEFKRVERRFDLWKQMLDGVLKDSSQGPRSYPRKDKEAAFAKDPSCAECGQKIQDIDDAQMDHIEPYSKGGKTLPKNAALTHRYCNLVKSAGPAAKPKTRQTRKRIPSTPSRRSRTARTA